MKKHTLFVLTLSFLLLPFALTGAGAGAGGAAAQTRAPLKSIPPRGISVLTAIKSRLEENMHSPERIWNGTICLPSTGKEVPIIIAAIEENDIAFLQILFKKSKESTISTYLNKLYKTDLIDDDKVTPLHLAIEKMESPLVKLLLEHGADASLTNPLAVAFTKALVHRKHGGDLTKLMTLHQILMIIEILLDSGANINAVNPDIVTNTLDVIDKLYPDLKEKIKRKLSNAIDEKAESKSERIGAASEHEAASEEKAKAMQRAAMTMPTPPGTGAGSAAQTSPRARKIARGFDMIKSLVVEGASLKSTLESIVIGAEEPMIIAAIQENENDLLELVFNKANKDELTPYINKKYILNSGTELTPLGLAVTHASLPIVQLLLRHGAKATAHELTLAFSKLRFYMLPPEQRDMVRIIELLHLHGANINEVEPSLVTTALEWLARPHPRLKKLLEKGWILTQEQEERRKKESDLIALQLAQEEEKEKQKKAARAKKEEKRVQKQAEAREKQLADAEQKRQKQAEEEKRKKEKEQAEKEERKAKAEAARLKAEQKKREQEEQQRQAEQAKREKEKADRDKHEQEKLAKIKAKKQERKQKKLAERAAAPDVPGEPAPGVIAEHAPAVHLPKAGELDPALRAARERKHKEESDAKAAGMRIHDQELERGEGEPVRREPQIEGEGSEAQPGLIEVEPGFVVEPGQPEERKEPIERKERKEEAELKGAAAGPAALRAYARPKSDEQLRKEAEAITFLRNYKNGPRKPDITAFHTYALWKSGAPLPNDFYWLLLTELDFHRTDGRLSKTLYKQLKADGSCNWFKDDVSGYTARERTLRLLIQSNMQALQSAEQLLGVIALFEDKPTPAKGLERLKANKAIISSGVARYFHYIIQTQGFKALRAGDGGTLPKKRPVRSLEDWNALYRFIQ